MAGLQSGLTVAHRPVKSSRGYRLLILQATPFCNIDCEYCYLPDRTVRHVFPIEGYDVLCSNLVASGLNDRELRVCWHAGEPLVQSASYFEAAVARIGEFQSAFSEIRYSVQTNAMLVTDEHCRLFEQHRFHVGISLDGPKPLHDHFRKDRAGNGTFDRAIAGVQKLKAREIQMSAICVVHSGNVSEPDSVFDFFCDLGVESVGFNIDEFDGSRVRFGAYERDRRKRLTSFLRRLYERNAESGFPLKIREFDPVVNSILTGQPTVRRSVNVPFEIVTVNSEGDFSTFCPELLAFPKGHRQDLVLGNIYRDGFRSTEALQKLGAIQAKIDAGVSRCEARCEYFRFCGGGAPSNKLAEHGRFDVQETEYCVNYEQAIVDAGVDFLSNL